MSYPKFGGRYPKQKLISKLRALPHPLTREPPPGGGLSGDRAPTKTIFRRGGVSPPALTKRHFFLCSVSFPTRFSLRAQAQRKANKRNAKGRRAKGNFLKKVSSGLFQKLSGGALSFIFFKIFRGGVGAPFCKRRPHRVPPPRLLVTFLSLLFPALPGRFQKSGPAGSGFSPRSATKAPWYDPARKFCRCAAAKSP